jgi:hypothetical protein
LYLVLVLQQQVEAYCFSHLTPDLLEEVAHWYSTPELRVLELADQFSCQVVLLPVVLVVQYRYQLVQGTLGMVAILLFLLAQLLMVAQPGELPLLSVGQHLDLALAVFCHFRLVLAHRQLEVMFPS